MYESKGLLALEEKLGISFECKSLLVTALSHRGHNEGKITSKRESLRLSLIGDKVCDLVLFEHLYFEGYSKGEMDDARKAKTNREALNTLLRETGIIDFLILDGGVGKAAPASSKRLGAEIFEALVGAIYLDKGFLAAESFVKRHLLKTMVQDMAK
jgi:ribonuclease-3